MKTIKTYQFKLKPNKAQVKTFEQWIDVCRYVYNLALDYKSYAYRTQQVNVSKYDIQKQITELRAEYEWIKDVACHTLQDVTDRLFRSYEGYFKNVGKYKSGRRKIFAKFGHPKFAKKGKYRSFGFKGSEAKFHQNTCTVSLMKIGKIKYRKSRDFVGRVLHTRIIKKSDGWYVSAMVETEHTPLPKSNNNTGLDYGINSLATINGKKINNPRWIFVYERKLKLAHRAVARKEKGSNNKKKAIKKLALIHKKVADSRKDNAHKITSMLVSENQVIGRETLNILGMAKNYKLAKSIYDAGWGMMNDMLKYKCEWNERNLVDAKMFYPSSRTCSCCGYQMKHLALNVREWECPVCKTVHDRDENSEKNLREMAVGHTVSACGDSERNDIALKAHLSNNSMVIKASPRINKAKSLECQPELISKY